MPQAEYRAGERGCGLVSVFDVSRKLKRLEDYDGAVIVNVGIAGEMKVTARGEGKGFFVLCGRLHQKTSVGGQQFAGVVPITKPR